MVGKTKIRRGDTVRILRGRDRGRTGKVMAVLPRDHRVVVEGLHMVKKHVRPRRAGEKGQRVNVAAPLQVSAVQLICPNCRKPTRVTIVDQGGRKRVCKKCHTPLDS